MTDSPPKIENAPGLRWRRKAKGFVAEWQARTDLVRRGWAPKSVTLAVVEGDMTAAESSWIADRCNALQSEMLVWGRGGIPEVSQYDGTLGSLVRCYQLDPDSRYRKIRYQTRLNYDVLCKRISREHGSELIREIRPRQIVRWHEAWAESGIPMAHALMGMLRTLLKFGVSILEDDECVRVRMIMHDMRFEVGQARKEQITAEQAAAIRAIAHRMGFPSIALAQAVQFDCTLRQKDVIGEWVPFDDPEVSGILHTLTRSKWVRGITWQEIDDNFILRHKTSKKGKTLVVNLRLAPMVMEELNLVAGLNLVEGLTRSKLPATGPLIIAEGKFGDQQPWAAHRFRRHWREAARAAGIPDEVFNMDSRAGAITEGLDATDGNLNAVKHAATHGNIAMTQRYDRSGAKIVEDVMEKRQAHRNRKRTKDE